MQVWSMALDLVSDGVLLLDACGRELHRNRVLAEWLDDPLDGPLLVEAIARALRMRTPVSPIRLRGMSMMVELHEFVLPAAPDTPAAMLVMRLFRPIERTDAELRREFRLTERECQVARALAAGFDNAAVARALGVRAATARRHTEAVLRKLGVARRAAVAARLLSVPGSESSGHGTTVRVRSA